MIEELSHSKRSSKDTRLVISKPSSWLVLPFHPCWGQAKIARAIRAVNFLFLECEDFSRFAPRISWCNGGKHLWRRV